MLTDEQVDAARTTLNGWQRAGGVLRRSIKFPTFMVGIDAVRFGGRRASRGGKSSSDIDIRWRTVTFALVTHAVGGITENDIAMAHDIDAMFGAHWPCAAAECARNASEAAIQ